MTLIIKNVKFGINIGDTVPVQDPNDKGNVGRYIEQVIKDRGVTVNSSFGIDIPDLKMEVKTRNNDATSPFTICRMKINEIVQTPYDHSRVYQSIENMLLVRYDNNVNKITSVEVYNWASWLMVNDIFRVSYEEARKIFQNSCYCESTVRGDDCIGYFELSRNVDSDDVYQFRISDKNLKKLESTKKMPALRLFEFE